MPKAVLKNGVILPVEPLPAHWKDGRELLVEAADDFEENDDFEEWMRELNRLVAQNDESEFVEIERKLHAADLEAKNLMRKEMGLP
jgi:predicted oxidoreductase